MAKYVGKKQPEPKHIPKLFNKYHGNAPADAVYIGRGSPWANPWSHLPSKYPDVTLVSSREEACRLFKEAVLANPENIAEIKKHLKGKDLVCFCAPKQCHGDILLKIANEE